MGDFRWGNTRLVTGEGGGKKVIMNDEEKWDESMVPLEKFSGMLAHASAVNRSNSVLLRVRGGDTGHGFPNVG